MTNTKTLATLLRVARDMALGPVATDTPGGWRHTFFLKTEPIEEYVASGPEGAEEALDEVAYAALLEVEEGCEPDEQRAVEELLAEYKVIGEDE